MTRFFSVPLSRSRFCELEQVEANNKLCWMSSMYTHRQRKQKRTDARNPTQRRRRRRKKTPCRKRKKERKIETFTCKRARPCSLLIVIIHERMYVQEEEETRQGWVSDNMRRENISGNQSFVVVDVEFFLLMRIWFVRVYVFSQMLFWHSS